MWLRKLLRTAKVNKSPETGVENGISGIDSKANEDPAHRRGPFYIGLIVVKC